MYDQIVLDMKRQFGLRIKRWRKRMSGCAWRAWYADGSVINWVEAPYPKSPMSLAVFLHEVGHHAIGFDTYKVRCEEEWAAWQWSLHAMRQLGVTPTPRVLKRVDASLRYAVAKAERRGIKRLPEQLVEYSRAA